MQKEKIPTEKKFTNMGEVFTEEIVKLLFYALTVEGSSAKNG